MEKEKQSTEVPSDIYGIISLGKASNTIRALKDLRTTIGYGDVHPDDPIDVTNLVITLQSIGMLKLLAAKGKLNTLAKSLKSDLKDHYPDFNLDGAPLSILSLLIGILGLSDTNSFLVELMIDGDLSNLRDVFTMDEETFNPLFMSVLGRLFPQLAVAENVLSFLS